MYPRRGLIALGIVAFIVSVAALVPARLLIAALPASSALRITDPSGTLWQGQAQIATSRGAYSVSWDLHPWQLLLLGAAGDWQVTSDGVTAEGGVVLRPWGHSLIVRRAELSGARLAQMFSRSGLAVDQSLLVRDVEVSRARDGQVRSAEGVLAWGPGTVRLRDRPDPLSVPALHGRLEASEGNLRMVVDGEPMPGQTLATLDADFRTGELHAVVLQRAADMLGLAEKGRRPHESTLVELRQPLH